MQSNIARWGNSLALRLPSHIARETRLAEGAAVNIEMKDDGSLILTPVRKKLKLSDLLAQMPDRAEPAEFDWGEPKGEEEW